LGGRFDLVIWDDVWDPRKMRNSESRADMYRWWDEVAETRLEPGGLFILNGQRMSSDDIYRYALDKKTPVEEEDTVGEVESSQVSSLPDETSSPAFELSKYSHLKYKVHYEDRCEGDHGLDAKPYPKAACFTLGVYRGVKSVTLKRKRLTGMRYFTSRKTLTLHQC